MYSAKGKGQSLEETRHKLSRAPSQRCPRFLLGTVHIGTPAWLVWKSQISSIITLFIQTVKPQWTTLITSSGNLSKSKYPDSSQGPALQARLAKKTPDRLIFSPQKDKYLCFVQTMFYFQHTSARILDTGAILQSCSDYEAEVSTFLRPEYNTKSK